MKVKYIEVISPVPGPKKLKPGQMGIEASDCAAMGLVEQGVIYTITQRNQGAPRKVTRIIPWANLKHVEVEPDAQNPKKAAPAPKKSEPKAEG